MSEKKKKKKKKDKNNSLSVIIAFLGMLIVIFLFFAIVMFRGEIVKEIEKSVFVKETAVTEKGTYTTAGVEKVIVPDVTGLTEEAALEALKGTGLGIKVNKTVSSPQPYGTILEQNPLAGTEVDIHSSIMVDLSGGASFIKMPNLQNKDLADAERILEENNVINIRTEKEYNLQYTIGKVIDTNPIQGDTVSMDADVTLKVSAGSSKVSASPQNYIGMKYEEAIVAAYKDLLVPTIKYIYSDMAKEGVVCGQSVEPNAPVLAGTGVVFTVSKGKASDKINGKEKKKIKLSVPKTATGTAYRIIAFEKTNFDEYEILADSGESAPAFPYELEIPITTGADECVVRYYEKNEEERYIPRAEWEITGENNEKQNQ